MFLVVLQVKAFSRRLQVYLEVFENVMPVTPAECPPLQPAQVSAPWVLKAPASGTNRMYLDEHRRNTRPLSSSDSKAKLSLRESTADNVDKKSTARKMSLVGGELWMMTMNKLTHCHHP